MDADLDATLIEESEDEEAMNVEEVPLRNSPIFAAGADGQSPKKRPQTEHEDIEDDGKTCPICLDNWTNLGCHRICALKCGHLFGLRCIMRWFSKQKSCPTCKKKAARGEIIYIYTRKLTAMDATKLLEVKKQFKKKEKRLQYELMEASSRERRLTQQVKKLKEKVQHLVSGCEVKRLTRSRTRSS